MLILSLLVNGLIVFPVSFSLLADQPGMTAVFGPASDARAILASVYLAIGLVSLAGLFVVFMGYGAVIRPMAMGLFTMQIVYKVITIWTVGLASPVVLTNIAVVVLHSATLLVLSQSDP